MNQKIPAFLLRHTLIRGTLLLTLSGLLVRAAGFLYKIFLSRAIGAEQIGLFSLAMPLFAFFTALCGGGIQTAISRFAAEYRAKGDPGGAQRILCCGLLLSAGLSVPCSLLLFLGAPWLSVHVLMEPSCEPLLRLIAPSLPFCMIHSCMDGYFTGQNDVLPPALTQLAEQTLRIGTALFACAAAKRAGVQAGASVMAVGHLCGEIASAGLGFLLLKLRHGDNVRGTRTAAHKSGASEHAESSAASTAQRLSSALFRLRGPFLQILSVSVPLSVNRTLLSVLQSMEAALIPQMLQQNGFSGSEALTVYGALTGMAMPLILFPTALTGALGMLLLPSVSAANSLHQQKKIAAATNAGFCGGLALGSFFLGVFLLFGGQIGILLFQSSLAGSCIRRLALICPLLYISMTLTGILHALGKTFTLLLFNLLSFTLRLACILFLIPGRGLDGWLFGLLLGQSCLTVCILISLRRAGALTCSAADAILRLLTPALCSAGLTAALFPAVLNTRQFSVFPGLAAAGLCYTAVFLPALYLPEWIRRRRAALRRKQQAEQNIP